MRRILGGRARRYSVGAVAGALMTVTAGCGSGDEPKPRPAEPSLKDGTAQLTEYGQDFLRETMHPADSCDYSGSLPAIVRIVDAKTVEVHLLGVPLGEDGWCGGFSFLASSVTFDRVEIEGDPISLPPEADLENR